MDYITLANLYDQIFSTTKRLEKTYYIAEFLKKITEEKSEDTNSIFLFLKGKVFPDWDDTKINFAAKMAVKAIATSTGISQTVLESQWRKVGDLGIVAEEATKKKKQSTLFSRNLSVEKVYNNLLKLSSQEGQGSVDIKVKLVSELLTSAKPSEAKYIIRTLLEDMRVGIGDSSIRDAVAWSCFDVIERDEKNQIQIKEREEYNKLIEIIQEAYDVANDWNIVYEAAKKGIEDLQKIKLQINNPIKVMLFPKALDYEDAFERVGKPSAWEYKYDGFRMQIHKNDDEVTIFTRRLDKVTMQFPEVKERIQKYVNAKNCILDCEAVGYDKKTGTFLPFQHVSQRIKRKHGISEMIKELPVQLNVFDIMYYNGESQLKVPFQERRKVIESILESKPKEIMPAEQIITDSIDEAKEFFKKAVDDGNEGLMAKRLDSLYKPGARVGYGVKIKTIKETLDLVIIKAEHGEGKRAGWLSSFTVACLDEEGNLLEMGKVSTGLKEKDEEGTSFNQITELLKPLITSEEGKEVTVKPKVIIEIGYEEIQKSPSYTSGYALRFPRFLKLREDKALDEVSSIDYIDQIYRQQK